MASRALIFEATGLWAPRRSRLSASTIDGLLMLAAAFALRCWWFGDPVVQVDEQFYLLVGDRLLHGAVPFVDIWDRKPIGLFLIYAAIRLFGGSGVLEYQLIACAFAAAAALFVVRMARLFASETAARLAGAAALIWFIVFDGEGGQSPIFYDPIVAAAAMLTFAAYRADSARRIALAGSGAMALIGLAIQIKYTVLFEGVGFGLLLLWSGWRAELRLPKLAGLALLWAGLAVLPTVAALAIYADRGEAAPFVYANFLSIGHRDAGSVALLAKRLGIILLEASPLVIAAGIAMRGRFEGEAARMRRFMLVWLGAAVAGMLSIGALYTHYTLPVIVPLAIAAAPAFDWMIAWRGRTWRPALAILLIGCAAGAYLSLVRLHKRGDGSQVRAIAAAIRPRLNGCLFVFDGEPILYQMTHACFVSPYVFPSHLNDRKEAAAIGADPVREVARVMDTHPAMIVTSNRPAKSSNRATWALMQQRLQHGYALVAAVPLNRRIRLVYQRIA
ncbi:4-amino-4-deoxy-L-arabinose transferase-like glycosyltransferase [Sphingomonas vulcanisoli]|uniref:4-amino-4-deoxy-L-arabinose transferase-like glycosyltransferase n=1 Tax=Sphingomonas vulcanisoli TaxID=1658060 RepID=A0ABX0TRV2_9SPHN|nr:glycosyltransferase family 39 protein [Sphingomonas vulcanisoli]NIJ08257.1 4-amino-4-deoxy-L-arabinose transferase-like glycosyltransferase [Sphingomonas vulcanisoli]